MLRAFLPTSQLWHMSTPPSDDLSACRPRKKPGGRRQVRAKPTHRTPFFETLESRTLLAGNPGPSLFINDGAVLEGNDGTVNANFSVSLSSSSSQVVTVQYSTSNGTATAPSDYTTTSGTLSFSPGETMKTVSVPVIGDTLMEPNETFYVNLSNPTNATISDGQGVGTITNDDAAPSITVSDGSVSEGNAGTTNASVVVSLTATSSQTVTVQYFTSDGTATAPGDYAATSGTLSFAPGTTSQLVTVAVNGDTLPEQDEIFYLNLSNPTNATILDGQGVVTVTNDDAAVAVSINDVTVAEGNSGTVSASFTVSLSAASGQTVTVHYATAAVPGDYEAVSGTLSFVPGETTKTVIVLVNGDTLHETDETFLVNLSSATNATILDSQGVATIANDDAAPSLAVSDFTVTEGDSGTVDATLIVSLSGASSQTVTVQYATLDATATAPSDYTATSGTLSFAPGTTGRTVTIQVNGDAYNEPNETFYLNLSNPTVASISDGQGLATITNDDPTPSLSVSDVTVAEGNSGTVDASFVVSLSAASGQTVTVQYTSSDDLATAPDDYTAVSGTLTFVAGTTSLTVTVAINGDTLVELDEIFSLNLSNPTNATIADAQGVGTITDDDAPLPTLAVGDVALTEGDVGVVNATFTVTLSEASADTITVAYETENGTAVAPDDYISASGTLSFPPGATSGTVSVAINGDTIREQDEDFVLRFSSAANATITDGEGVGTIRDDDPLPSLAVDDVVVTEGDAETTTVAVQVRLSAASGQNVTLQYYTANGTAAAPGDYSPEIGTLVFEPGTTSQIVNVSVNGDTEHEPDETFTLNLVNTSNATIADGQAVATIQNDDAVPAIFVTDVAVTEGTDGLVLAEFEVTLSAPSGQTVTVDYFTENATALAPDDYMADTGRLTFAPGSTNQIVVIVIATDSVAEPDETFFLKLQGAVNASIADGEAVATIVDDDTGSSGSGSSGDGGTGGGGTGGGSCVTSSSNPAVNAAADTLRARINSALGAYNSNRSNVDEAHNTAINTSDATYNTNENNAQAAYTYAVAHANAAAAVSAAQAAFNSAISDTATTLTNGLTTADGDFSDAAADGSSAFTDATTNADNVYQTAPIAAIAAFNDSIATADPSDTAAIAAANAAFAAALADADAAYTGAGGDATAAYTAAVSGANTVYADAKADALSGHGAVSGAATSTVAAALTAAQTAFNTTLVAAQSDYTTALTDADGLYNTAKADANATYAAALGAADGALITAFDSACDAFADATHTASVPASPCFTAGGAGTTPTLPGWTAPTPQNGSADSPSTPPAPPSVQAPAVPGRTPPCANPEPVPVPGVELVASAVPGLFLDFTPVPKQYTCDRANTAHFDPAIWLALPDAIQDVTLTETIQIDSTGPTADGTYTLSGVATVTINLTVSGSGFTLSASYVVDSLSYHESAEYAETDGDQWVTDDFTVVSVTSTTSHDYTIDAIGPYSFVINASGTVSGGAASGTISLQEIADFSYLFDDEGTTTTTTSSVSFSGTGVITANSTSTEQIAFTSFDSGTATLTHTESGNYTSDASGGTIDATYFEGRDSISGVTYDETSGSFSSDANFSLSVSEAYGTLSVTSTSHTGTSSTLHDPATRTLHYTDLGSYGRTKTVTPGIGLTVESTLTTLSGSFTLTDVTSPTGNTIYHESGTSGASSQFLLTATSETPTASSTLTDSGDSNSLDTITIDRTGTHDSNLSDSGDYVEINLHAQLGSLTVVDDKLNLITDGFFFLTQNSPEDTWSTVTNTSHGQRATIR